MYKTVPFVITGTALAVLFLGYGGLGAGGSDRSAGRAWPMHVIDNSARGADGVKLGDVNGDGHMDIAAGWEESGLVRVYLHPGPERVREPWPAVTVGTLPAVEDAVLTDLDGDGGLDVVSAAESPSKAMVVHWGPGNGAALRWPQAWESAVLPASEGRMAWLFAGTMQIDGRHGPDLIAGGKDKGAAVGWFEAPAIAGTAGGRDLAGYQWHPISAAGWVMSLQPRDMDGDGDPDIVVADRHDALRGARWLENPGLGPAQREAWANHFMGAAGEEAMDLALADLDRDGLEDALVPVTAYRILWLRRMDLSGLNWRTYPIELDPSMGRPRSVAVGDMNGDGQLDLVLTTWNAQGKHGVVWLEYEASPAERLWRAHAISGKGRGVKFDRLELLDLDGDGDLDVLTCEESEGGGGLGVVWYENRSTH